MSAHAEGAGNCPGGAPSAARAEAQLLPPKARPPDARNAGHSQGTTHAYVHDAYLLNHSKRAVSRHRAPARPFASVTSSPGTSGSRISRLRAQTRWSRPPASREILHLRGLVARYVGLAQQQPPDMDALAPALSMLTDRSASDADALLLHLRWLTSGMDMTPRATSRHVSSTHPSPPWRSANWHIGAPMGALRFRGQMPPDRLSPRPASFVLVAGRHGP